MANYVSANELARIVSSRHRITKVECRQIVDLIFQSIAIGLRTGTDTRVPLFGVFTSVQRPQRLVWNPRKQTKTVGAARVVPHVRWSSKLAG